jgi:hypothetical protein
MIATQDRAALFPDAYSFPPVPPTNVEFISTGLTTRPTFFGCNTNSSAPLVIYIANGGPPRNLTGPPLTNTSSLQAVYQPDILQTTLDQSWQIATQGKSDLIGVDKMWPACLACAVVDRARLRSGKGREGVCASCFERYCWPEAAANKSVVDAASASGELGNSNHNCSSISLVDAQGPIADGASVNSNDTSTSTSRILIALAVIGGLLFVGLLTALFFFMRSRSRRSMFDSHKYVPTSTVSDRFLK